MGMIFWRIRRNFQEFSKSPSWRGFLKKWSPTSFFGNQFTSDFPIKKKQSGNSLCFEKKFTSDFPRKK